MKNENKFDPKKTIKRMEIMTKPIGPKCNIDCDYCYYLSKDKLLDYKKDCSPEMPIDDLEQYIKSYIEQQNFPEIVFHWQGGEPTLLGVKYFREAVRLQKKYCPDNVTIHNNIQTNGTLLNDEWGRFLAKNKFLVGISIDGPELVHNTYRTNKAGRGTWRQTMKGLEFLHKHNVEFATLTCVNNISGNSPLEVYTFLRDVVKSKQMQFIPIVEPKSFRDTAPQHWDKNTIVRQGSPEANPIHPDSIVEKWCVSDKQWGTFLSTIFDEWMKNDFGKINVPYFEASIEAWMGRVNPLCTLGPMCGKGLAMESNGDVFSCDHYVYPEYKLGNIKENTLDELQFSQRQEQFGKAKEGTLTSKCRQCKYQFACYGECPKNRFLATPEGEVGQNYLCSGWYQFFDHIDPYMSIILNSMGYPINKGLNSEAMKLNL